VLQHEGFPFFWVVSSRASFQIVAEQSEEILAKSQPAGTFSNSRFMRSPHNETARHLFPSAVKPEFGTNTTVIFEVAENRPQK